MREVHRSSYSSTFCPDYRPNGPYTLRVFLRRT
jgi:hypothetical protein